MKTMRYLSLWLIGVAIMIASMTVSSEAGGLIYKSDPNNSSVLAVGIKTTDIETETKAKLYVKLTQFPYKYEWFDGLEFYYTFGLGDNESTLVEEKMPFVEYDLPIETYNIGEFFRIPFGDMAPGFYIFEAYLEEDDNLIPEYAGRAVFEHNCVDESCDDFKQNCINGTEYSNELTCGCLKKSYADVHQCECSTEYATANRCECDSDYAVNTPCECTPGYAASNPCECDSYYAMNNRCECDAAYAMDNPCECTPGYAASNPCECDATYSMNNPCECSPGYAASNPCACDVGYYNSNLCLCDPSYAIANPCICDPDSCNNPIVINCGDRQDGGNEGKDNYLVDFGYTPVTFVFDYDTYGVPDRVTLTYEGGVLVDSGCKGISDTEEITLTGTETYIRVDVEANCSGTSSTGWDFTVHCPTN